MITAGHKLLAAQASAGGSTGSSPWARANGDFWVSRRHSTRSLATTSTYAGRYPDSLVSFIVRQPFFGTLGLTSEWVFRTIHGDFGFRIAEGWTLGPSYNNITIYDSPGRGAQQLHYNYFGFSAHYTYDRWTFWFQGESAKKGSSSQVGFIYRLSSPRAPAKQHIDRPQPPHPPHPPLPSWLPHHPGGD